MQNVALGAFGYKLTHSAGYVALLTFAQLGPVLALSILSGVLADAVDRRLVLIAAQVEQMAFSFLLAWVAHAHHPSKAAIFWCVLAVGIGNAVNGPVFSAVLPILVGRRDLGGAVSLQSMQLNLSRVIGPAIGGLLLPAIGAAGVFALNGVTYLFAIATLIVVAIPRPYPPVGERGVRRLVAGFAVAARDRLVRNCLLTMFTMSLLCLPFVGLMPVVAARQYHISTTGLAYGVMYAVFGLGAALGAISIGTVMVAVSKARIARRSLLGFGVALAAMGSAHAIALAFPISFFLGVAYFSTVTSLSTVLQQHLDDATRGRVMALWIMAFGGTVPIGVLIGGWVAGFSSIGAVLRAGAVIAVLLAFVTNLNPARAEVH
jgi:MFS family permease